MVAELELFEEVELPDLQKSVDGVPFPIVLSPNPNFKKTDQLVLSDLTEAIQAHKPWLESLLYQHGAILLRGFPVTSASDFNDVVEALGFPDMPYFGGAAIRHKVVGRVYTANESPAEHRINFHNELAHAKEYPTKIFFFCEVEPGKGGGTGIVPGHLVYNMIKEKYPEFVQQLEEHGVVSVRALPEEDNDSAIDGSGWKSTFSTNDKSVAEQRAMKLGLKLQWQGNTAIRISARTEAVKFDEEKQRKIWFNGFAATYGKSVRKGEPVYLPTFGNGEAMPSDVVLDCIKMMDEASVAIPWRKGDVLLVDNFRVLHSRMALLKPPRSILASLCK